MGLLDELNDKANEDFNNKIKALDANASNLNGLVTALRGEMQSFKPEVTHSYKLSDEVALNALKTSIMNLGRQINDLDKIPETIALETQTIHSTDKKSHNFLWWYFAVSTLVIALCVGSAVYVYINQHNAVKQAETTYFNKGLQEGQKRIYNALPTSSQNYLKNKYPDAKFE